MFKLRPSKRTKQVGWAFNCLFASSFTTIIALPYLGMHAPSPAHDYELSISRHEVFVDAPTFWAFVALLIGTFVVGCVYGLMLWSSRRR